MSAPIRRRHALRSPHPRTHAPGLGGDAECSRQHPSSSRRAHTQQPIAAVHEAAPLADGTDVLLVGSRAKVPAKIDVVPVPQLPEQEGQSLGRHVIGGFGERSQEADAAKKRCVSEAVVGAPEVTDREQRTLVENKALGEIFSRGRAIEAAEVPALGVGQVACRHGARNAKVLRRPRAALKTRGNSFAQHVCESESFCNEFRTRLEAAV